VGYGRVWRSGRNVRPLLRTQIGKFKLSHYPVLALNGRADSHQICSLLMPSRCREFSLLTYLRHRWPIFAVMRNTALIPEMCYSAGLGLKGNP
jgi:hypothetical protein